MVDKKVKDGDKRKKKNGSDVIKDVDAGYATGYDTDAASTSKSRAKLKKKTKTRKADGYETEDDGYMSTSTNQPSLKKTKSKSRFFKLGNRSKSNIDEDETVVRSPVASPPPVPAPTFRLPIAAKFATTLNLDTDNALLDPPIGPLGMPAAQNPFGSSSSTPVPGFIHRNAFNEDVESITSAPAPSITTTASPSKRAIIRFASDSSDNHGTGSSNGHSFLSRFTAASSSSASTTGSVTAPPVKSLNISYPLTRSPSSQSLNTQPIVLSPPPAGRSKTKQAPRPLFLDRIPSDNPPSEWSPANSPFVVLSPSPRSASSLSGRPATAPTTGSHSHSHLATPSSGSARAASPAGSSRDVIPSMDFIVPSPSNDVFVPPSSLSHYDIPPPSPPPTVPLPDVPTLAQQQHSREGRMFEAQQGSYLDSQSPSPFISPQRGRVSPFPTQPSGSVPKHPGPVGGFESRMRVKRYRDIYAMPSPKGGWQDSKGSGYASSPETSTSKRNARQSPNVGISVEQPSDDEDDYDSDAAEVLKNVLQGLTDDDTRSTAMGYRRGVEPEAALDRRRSLEVLQNYYNNTAYAASHRPPVETENPPRASFSPYASEDDLSDDKSRYTSDEKRSMYKTNNDSQARSLASGWADDHRWSMSMDGESRASFMDADKSDEARERFIRRIEAMFDENGRELPPNLGIGKNAIVPPVPKIPEGLQTGSKTWI